LEILWEHPYTSYCDDRLADLLNVRRQAINQRSRRLNRQQLIFRAKMMCSCRGREKICSMVENELIRAVKNLKSAELSLRSGDYGDYRTCVIWSHQTVEAALEGVWRAKGLTLPKVHNLVELYVGVKDVMPPLDTAYLKELTDKFWAARKGEDMSKDVAERYLRFARSVMGSARESIHKLRIAVKFLNLTAL